MTKVSVIIPVYNVEKYLRQCLDSILGQTLKEIEVICVDDGSSDSSPLILAEYAAKDSRLKVLTQANSGAAVARNAGLAAAKGEYLYFCDPDDWAKPQMLEKMTSLADQGNCDVVVASVSFYSEESQKIYKIWTGPKDLLERTEPFSARDVADRVFRSFLWSPWNKLLRRAFVISHKLTYQNLPRCNDIAFNATALALAERILFDKTAYYYYRTDVLGSATALRDKHPNTHALAWDEVERRLKERGRYEPFADDLRRVRAIGELNTLKLISDAEAFAAYYACVRNERMPRYGFSADDFREIPEAATLRTELEAIEKHDSPLNFLLLRNRHITEALEAERTKKLELKEFLAETRRRNKDLSARLAALQRRQNARLCNRLKVFFERTLIAIIERRFFKTLFGVKAPGLLVRQIDMFLSRLAIRLVAWRYPIEPNKIVFTNFSGNYDCNPKYICEEILRRGLPGKKIWVVWGEGPHKNDTTKGRYPEELTLRERYSWPFYKDLFTAEVIVDNGSSFASAGYRKKRGQYMLNTFHGSLGIKCMPRNTSIHNWAYNHNARKASSMIDVMISNSAFEEKYYRETFFDGVPVERLGHARNDPLFRTESGYREAVKRKVAEVLGFSASVRICLYAPTFRDSADIRPYDLPYEKLREALSARWGGEWIILTRFHHQTKVLTKGLSFPDGVISATNYPDIVELMVAADVGITDYSSWICEFIHTGRPGFLYATDVAQYNENERLFYDPLDQMPFPLATDADTLLGRIRDFDETKYAGACADFLRQKGCMDDGHAASRIVDLIVSKVKTLAK